MSENKTQIGSNVADLTEDELDLLRRAGASDKVIQMCRQGIEGVVRPDGKPVQRHSVLQECKKYVRGAGGSPWLTEEKLGDFKQLGGSFFTAVWDGDLHAAYHSADPNNKALMEAAFSPMQINRTKPPSYAKVSF
jgi:hypothetical protein